MLREYQTAALESARAAFRAGKRRIILASPTGSGKSLIAAEMARGAVAQGHSVVFVVHLRTLVKQFSERLTADGLAHGIIMGGEERTPAAVQVCSIQTLSRRELPEPELLVIDECKRAASESYAKLFARWPNAKVVGLDGTPTRIDGRGLGDHFDELIHVAQAPELIAAGFLVPVRGFSFIGPSLQGVRTVAGEYNEAQIEERFDVPGIRGQVIGNWLRHASDRPTIVFAATIRHAEHLAESFQDIGVKAVAIHSESQDRDRLIAEIPETQVVVNVGIFQEGFDHPPWSCVVFARATQSVAVWLQGCGRGMRPAPGKTDLLLLDHGGNAVRLGLPSEERHWELSASEKQPARKSDALPISVCPSCYASWSKPPADCPACGHHEPVELPREKAGVAVPLEQIRANWGTEEQRRSFAKILIEEIHSKNYDRRYFFVRFKQRFPGAPMPWDLLHQLHRPQFSGWRRAVK